jgi:hypothetical protein
MNHQDYYLIIGIGLVCMLVILLQRDTRRLLNAVIAKLEKEKELSDRVNEILAQWQREKELEGRPTTEIPVRKEKP